MYLYSLLFSSVKQVATGLSTVKLSQTLQTLDMGRSSGIAWEVFTMGMGTQIRAAPMARWLACHQSARFWRPDFSNCSNKKPRSHKRDLMRCSASIHVERIHSANNQLRNLIEEEINNELNVRSMVRLQPAAARPYQQPAPQSPAHPLRSRNPGSPHKAARHCQLTVRVRRSCRTWP